jgi:diketogulonate reductase-like aldo/keto reductase
MEMDNDFQNISSIHKENTINEDFDISNNYSNLSNKFQNLYSKKFNLEEIEKGLNIDFQEKNKNNKQKQRENKEENKQEENKNEKEKEKDKFLNIYSTNKTKMPLIGLGTHRLIDVENSVRNAVKLGYRCFDTASYYKNEDIVGRVLNECISEGLVTREELFITTKLWNDEHRDPVNALKHSLKRMNMEYVDLYLIHFPLGKIVDGKLIKQIPLHKTWPKLEDCVSLGYCRHLGVSNFQVQILIDLLSYANVTPAVNEIELHPFLCQDDLIFFCKLNKIQVIAYNCFVKGGCYMRSEEKEKYDIFSNEIILRLAKKYEKTPAQIVLNWHLKRDICVIPRSSNIARQEENFKSYQFKMLDEEYLEISNLNCNKRFNTTKDRPFSAGIEIFA